MLGITVDDMLKFDTQVANICRKVSQQVAVLKRMRNIPPYDIRKNIYTSFIVPHFDYCAQTWHFCNKGSAEKLQKVNERAVRFVFRDKCAPFEKFLSILGRKTLMEQRLHKIICIVYTLVNHDTNPQSLIELICLKRKDILTMPKVNTTRFGLKSWRYQAPKPWNSLPDFVRASTDFKTSSKRSITSMNCFLSCIYLLLSIFISFSIHLHTYLLLSWHACKLAGDVFKLTI